jgi:hypothetical protein
MLVFWVPTFLVPPVLGFLIGRIQPSRWRYALLMLFIAAPPLVFTAWIATVKPAPEGVFMWWWVGMAMIAVPEAIWITGTLVGFPVGKRKLR